MQTRKIHGIICKSWGLWRNRNVITTQQIHFALEIMNFNSQNIILITYESHTHQFRKRTVSKRYNSECLLCFSVVCCGFFHTFRRWEFENIKRNDKVMLCRRWIGFISGNSQFYAHFTYTVLLNTIYGCCCSYLLLTIHIDDTFIFDSFKPCGQNSSLYRTSSGQKISIWNREKTNITLINN